IFFAGLILFFLGLIGEYIGRMFQGMTHNPQFVVRSVYTQNSAGSVARTQQNVNVNSERRTEDDDPSGEK
ncbi:MAG TPA: hypothetical protein DCZ71_00455, partial [Ruminococcus sp.]|nr:hypothetical protein [Ruminococcus sp.]